MSLDLKLVLEYYDSGKTLPEIAEIFNTYTNKIRRLVKKYRTLRNRSETQSLAIKTGRAKHPTKGTNIRQEIKDKISNTLHKKYSKLSKEERKKLVDNGSRTWYSMSDTQRHGIKQKAVESIKKASKEGSKLELAVKEAVEQAGYTVNFHSKDTIPNENMELDMYLPELKTVIEIDGPSHFYPIWGAEALNKCISADIRKSGLVLSANLVMIRVKATMKHISKFHLRTIPEKVLQKLEEIKNKFPEQKDRYIEIESE